MGVRFNTMKTITFKILTLTLFIGLLIPTLVQKGMFLDGITYAAISKNLATGYGQFWEPHYTKTLYPSFSEHPPFVFIIESLFFKLFGNHFYTERIFTFFTALLTALGIVMCWRELANIKIKENYWFPVLLWLLVPVVSWSYSNNMLENTMTVFTISSVFFTLKALKGNNIYLVPLSGLLIIFAFLSKGFVGLFPIATPLLFGIIFKENKKAAVHFIVLILSMIIISIISTKLYPEIIDNISRYLNQQFLPALQGQREVTTTNRFKILLDLFIDLAVMLALLIAFLIARIKNKENKKFVVNKNFLFFLTVGICASIPLIISLKQRKFYLIPSIPFYALSFGFLLNEYVMEKMRIVPEKYFKWFKKLLYSVIGLLLIISILKFGEYSRDTDKIKDVSLISNLLEEGTIISCTKETWSNWGLVAYFSRIGYISLDCDNEHDYFLIKNGDELPINFRQVELKGTNYTLLKKSTETNTLFK